MNYKRIGVIAVSVIFALVVIISVVAAFTLKRVSVVFSLSENTSCDTAEIEKTANAFLGSNLIFFDTENIKSEIEKNPYLEVTEIKKALPSGIDLKVKERKEVYIAESGGEKYFLSEDGVVLSAVRKNYDARKFVSLSVEGFDMPEFTVGKVAGKGNTLFTTAYALCKIASLNDRVKEMKIVSDVDFKDICFSTYTGVEIIIEKADEFGIEKTEAAFSLYEREGSDYYKTFDAIRAYRLDSGEIKAVWTRHGA